MSHRGGHSWNPTEAQRELFNEWRGFTIGYLVSSREGTNIRSIPGCLEENTGEEIPLAKMGFRTINQFLYEMQESIEVRTLNGKFFVFIREGAVPENMINIRQLVLGQAKDKGCKSKRSGEIRRPTRNQSIYCRAEELIDNVQHILKIPAASYVQRSAAPTGAGARRPGAPMNSSRPRPYGNAGNRYPTSSNTSRNSTAPRFGQSNTMRRPTQPSSYGNSKPFTYGTSNSNRPTSTDQPRSSTVNSNKENKPTSSMRSTWDDWNTPSSNSTTSTIKAKTSTTSGYTSNAPVPRFPRGLLLDNSSGDESDGFDYYAGPRGADLMKKGRETLEDFKVTISNPSATPAPEKVVSTSTRSTSSASSSAVSKPLSLVSGSSNTTDKSDAKSYGIARKESHFTTLSTVNSSAGAGSELNLSSKTTEGSAVSIPQTRPTTVIPSSSASCGSSLPPTSSYLPAFFSAIIPAETQPPKSATATKVAPASVPTTPIPKATLNLPPAPVSTTPVPKSAINSNQPRASVSTTPLPMRVTSNPSPNRVSPVPSATNAMVQGFNDLSLQDHEDEVVTNKPLYVEGANAAFSEIKYKQPTANSAVRMAFVLPKIRFPEFVRGGSLIANISLKGYLSIYS